MWMDLVEVHRSVWQLSQKDFCAVAVLQAGIVPFKRVDEAPGNAVLEILSDAVARSKEAGEVTWQESSARETL